MLSVDQQLDSGQLVCPATRLPLRRDGVELVAADGSHRYPLADGTPVMLGEAERRAYREGGETMFDEYRRLQRRHRATEAVNRVLTHPFLAPAARASFERVVSGRRDDELCLAVGGGPTRAHPSLVNLNIDLFENVDIVGDAYALPYADGSVEAVHINAVLEHLERPRAAVAEMFRVLRPAGTVYAQTPFLQAYHGYPHHYQNYTLQGHNGLFERAGFEILTSGAAVGPTFAIADLMGAYARAYVPGPLGRVLQKVIQLLSLVVRPLDMLIYRVGDAPRLASCVFVEARKPVSS